MTAPTLPPLNHDLPDLPSIAGTPLNRPTCHADVAALLDARRAAALEVAKSTADLAGVILARGDQAAARDLITEAQLYMVEVHAIDARRV